MPNLSQAHKQRWTPVPRIFPEFQYCIGSGEGGRGGGGREGGVNCKVFSKRRHPEISTDGSYEYHHRLYITVPRIFSQYYNFNEISVFKEPHSYSSSERSTPAYG